MTLIGHLELKWASAGHFQGSLPQVALMEGLHLKLLLAREFLDTCCWGCLGGIAGPGVGIAQGCPGGTVEVEQVQA